MSFRELAISFNITTPAGKPNKGMVKRIMQGYQPKRIDTLRRCGLLDMKPEPPIIHDEPARRVLTGAWYRSGQWLSPEEFFK